MLVMTTEPDFSMPFNVNAVTNILFGVLIVNTVFILFRSMDQEDEDKSEADAMLMK